MCGFARRAAVSILLSAAAVCRSATAARIALGLGASAKVSLRVYDAAGRLVRTVVEESRPAGLYGDLGRPEREGRGDGERGAFLSHRSRADRADE